MFSTCCYCHAALGANESIEHFPVGARLAFDGERGRLWTVCPRCARWNLAPIEERWEAIEECERAYRDARQRVSTDNIALARLKDGTDIVRIGRPLLPEFAAWRYGKQLRQRARRTMLIVGGTSGVASVATLGKLIAGTSLTGGLAVAVGMIPVVGHLGFAAWMTSRKHPRVALRETNGQLWGVSSEEIWSARIGITPDERLRVTIRDRPLRAPSLFNRINGAPYGWDTSSAVEPPKRDVQGNDAVSLLQLALPAAHRDGGSRADVKAAAEHVQTQWIGREAPAEQMIARWLARPGDSGKIAASANPAHGVLFSNIPAPFRLAAEMALQEADERRALAGELGALYARWEEAERIARIADSQLAQA